MSLRERLPFGMRPLPEHERERAFPGRGQFDLSPYMDAIREMEGGVAYAIPLNDSTQRALRVRFGRAAKKLGLGLRWAKQPADAKEVIVELKP